MKRKSFLAKASMMLLAVLFSLTGARAQQALPYEYGFENKNLATDGWVAQGATAETTAISNGGGCPKTGNYGFAITYSEENFYLISPLLVGGEDGVLMSFWYKEYSSEYGDEQFRVGYTTDEAVTDATEFTYGDVVTASTDWQEYTNSFPAGTKRIAIKYIYNDCYFLFLDDFSFEAVAEFMTPTNLVASEVGPYSAKLSWTERGKATSWVISVYDETVDDSFGEFTTSENPYTLTGLTPNHTYSVYVRPAGENAAWSEGVFFTTVFTAPAELAASDITTTSAKISWTGLADSYNMRYATSLFYDDFEDGLDDWTIYADGEVISGKDGWYTIDPTGGLKIESHSGTYCASAWSWNSSAYDANNWLVTPKVTLNGTLSFWVRTNAGYPDSYEVLLSTTDNAEASFTVELQAMAAAPTTGAWEKVEIDLSSYAGQEGYIAIHHVSYDCNYLLIDDFAIIDTDAWTTITGITSPYTLDGLTESTIYAVEVKSVYGTDGESQWTNELFFSTQSPNPVPYNIAADLAADGATFTWEGLGDSYNVRYRTAESAGETIFEDNFDNGLDKWTTVTAGEGPGWVIGTETGGNAATAYSWNSAGSYNADNWLISPAVELGGVLKFFANTATSYPDSYEVLLSTTGTEIADFTETLQAMAAAAPGEVTIDLSAYAGQTGYIAIHHVSYDCYLLIIDDFGVYAPNVPAGEWQDMAVADKTATINGLTTNTLYEYQIQSVKNEKASEWSKLADFVLLTLDSDADNTKTINQYNGKFAHVTLADRTFYKNNSWNTIYLPFNLTLGEVATSPLADADIRTLGTVSDEDKTVTLNFIEDAVNVYGKFYGGMAYIVKWAEGDNIVNPAFANVTITTDKYYAGDKDKVKFVGTYAPISFEAEDKSILFVGAENKLYWPESGAKIGAMRGYFELVGMTAEMAETGAKQFILNLGDEDATGIETVDNRHTDNSSIYNLAGQKMSKMQKGINIVNGKKILK